MPRVYTKKPRVLVPCLTCGRLREQERPSRPLTDRCPSCRSGRPLAERFWEKVDKNGPVPAHKPELGQCWIANGNRSTTRPQITVDGFGSPVYMARAAFFLAEGRWPTPCICHHCDNPRCVRRSHLFEGTQLDNIADMDAKGRRRPRARKTLCPKGHPYSGENLYQNPSGARVCRACQRDHRRTHDATRRRGP